MALKFCVDRIVEDKAYPNLAVWRAEPYTPEWRQFSLHWPFSEPVHFFEYLDTHNIAYSLVSIDDADKDTLYPISITFFDFGVPWFDRMSVKVIEKLRAKELKLWFFYSEGDNPERIRDHLHQQAQDKGIDPALIRFTSANSSAGNIAGFSHFVDDECLYWLRNHDTACDFHPGPRSKKFTMLVRTHKWWRATTMARFWKQHIDQVSYFSYNNGLDVDDREEDNPIEVDSFGKLRADTHEFLAHCPFHADTLDSYSHNQYSLTVREHFEDSYINVVIETHMDVDQSYGVFLTEKTFKPIKHAQPFLIFGAAGSIEQLRRMGYKTFDHVIDHRYDNIENTTQRWDVACQEVERLNSIDLHELYLLCKDDILWNQQLFLSSKKQRLNNLLERITL